MAKVDVKGLHRVTIKGKRYVYAWRGGPRIKAEEGSSEFIAELQQAQETRRHGDTRAFSSLMVRFLASDEWAALSDKTRTNWRPWLDKAKDKWGALPLAAFDRAPMKPVITAWHRTYRETPRAADMGLQALSRALSWGVLAGLVTTNACDKIPRLYSSDRAEIIWFDDDLEALRKVATPEIMFAAELASLTGLRQADLLKLAWSNVGQLSIEVRTGKSGGKRKAIIPMYGALRALLDRIPKRAATVLTSTTGQPWGSGFGASWQRARRKSGVDKHFHDLRGTAATRLYAADIKPKAIARIMGWSEETVEHLLTVYVDADAVLLEQIRRMDENASGTGLVKTPVKQSPPEGAK